MCMYVPVKYDLLKSQKGIYVAPTIRYSSDHKKVPVFIPYHGRVTVHRFNINSEKTAPRDPHYARSTRVVQPYQFCH